MNFGENIVLRWGRKKNKES